MFVADFWQIFHFQALSVQCLNIVTVAEKKEKRKLGKHMHIQFLPVFFVNVFTWENQLCYDMNAVQFLYATMNLFAHISMVLFFFFAVFTV